MKDQREYRYALFRCAKSAGSLHIHTKSSWTPAGGPAHEHRSGFNSQMECFDQNFCGSFEHTFAWFPFFFTSWLHVIKLNVERNHDNDMVQIVTKCTSGCPRNLPSKIPRLFPAKMGHITLFYIRGKITYSLPWTL